MICEICHGAGVHAALCPVVYPGADEIELCGWCDEQFTVNDEDEEFCSRECREAYEEENEEETNGK